MRNVILDKNSLSQWLEVHLLCVPSGTPCRNEALISLTDGIVVCRWFTSLSISPGNAFNQRELFIQVYTNCQGSHNPMIGQCCPLTSIWDISSKLQFLLIDWTLCNCLLVPTPLFSLTSFTPVQGTRLNTSLTQRHLPQSLFPMELDL